MKKLSIIIILVIILEMISFVFTFQDVKSATSDESTQKINESVAYAMSLLDDKMTDYEKAVVLANYTQEANLYRDSAYDQTYEGLLVYHESVCAGFAETYQLLMNTAGLPTEYVSSRNAAHAWNASLLNGEWTYSDTVKNPSRSRHQSAESKLFDSELDFDSIIYNGTMYDSQTAPPEAIENGEYLYFGDAVMSNHSSDLPNWDSVTIDGQDSYCSTLYFDDNYKYYIDRDDDFFYDLYLYRENRSTGQKDILAEATDHGGRDTNIVKDGDYIYYVGTDLMSIYQIKTDGSDNKKVYDNSSNGRQIAGVYVSDGYMYYATSKTESSRDYEYVQYKKLQNAVTTGSYTLNNSKQKYTLEYIKSSKGITISKCVGINGAEPTGEIYIPDTIDGMPVIGIGEKAFSGTELTGTLKLPKDLEYISYRAFYQAKMESIEFNDKLRMIGDYAFRYCDNLKGTIDFPDSLRILGMQAFCGCENLTGVNFGTGIDRIGSGAFWDDNKIEFIEIPEGIEYLDGDSFRNMEGLKVAILPESLKMYSEETFLYCDNLKEVWIKSPNIEAMTGNDEVDLYIPTGTQTSRYADENGIKYISDSKINIHSAQIKINNGTTGEENITNLELQPNEKVTLKLDIDPFLFNYGEVIWSVVNRDIAEINQNGELTAKSAGETTVLVSVNGRSVPVSLKVENTVLLGDVDQSGKVTATDGFLTYDIYLHEEELEPDVFTAADVDKSGKVTASDAFIIYDAYLHEITL